MEGASGIEGTDGMEAWVPASGALGVLGLLAVCALTAIGSRHNAESNGAMGRFFFNWSSLILMKRSRAPGRAPARAAALSATGSGMVAHACSLNNGSFGLFIAQ